MSQVSVLQIMLTPLTMGFAMFYLVAWVLHPQALVALAAVGWLLPLVALSTIIIALPVKVYAFLTMNVHGWLTRSADQSALGGEAQSAASLR